MTGTGSPYPSPTPLRQLTGKCLRPGGLELTLRGLSLCAFAPGSRLLDLGCGPGATLALLRERGHNCLGLDHSWSLLAEAVSTGPVVLGDFFSLPLAASCLDGVLCECALSLAEDKSAVLGECFRVLRPGGQLLLSDLTLPEEAGRGCAALLPPCVVGAVSCSVLEQLLRDAGFTIVFLEDHSRCLRELAARIIWQFGSMQAFAALWQGGSSDGSGAALYSQQGQRLDYVLLGARKCENTSD